MNDRVCPALLDRVRGEFREMPGLQLTVAQACRLWQIDRLACEALLRQLVGEKFLRETSAGAFIAFSEQDRSAGVPVDERILVRRRA